MTSGKPDYLGFGLGLRPQHYGEILEARPTSTGSRSLRELHVEGGKPLHMLDRICERYPVVMHGVSLSIASTAPLDLDYLVARSNSPRVQPQMDLGSFVLDRRAWREPARPAAYSLHGRGARSCGCARRAGAGFPRPPASAGERLELCELRGAEMTEWEFISRDCPARRLLAPARRQQCLCQRLQSWLLHRRIPARHAARPRASSSIWPAMSRSERIIDTHDHPVCPEVWDFYCQTVARLGPVSTMIERDDNIPPLADLVDELDHARRSRPKCSAASGSRRPPNEEPQRAPGEFPARHPRRLRLYPGRGE